MPVAPHPWIEAFADPFSDLSVEVLALRRLHRDIARKGVEKGDVLIGRVRLLPDVAPNLDLLEQAAGSISAASSGISSGRAGGHSPGLLSPIAS